MKRLITLFLLAIIPLLAKGYSFPELDVKWISENDIYVTTAPNAIAYQLPGRVTFYSWRADRDNKTRARNRINYDTYKQKKIKKPITLQVRGYCNRNEQLHFDTYAVEINGYIYLLPANHVSDNSVIGAVNNTLSSEYNFYVENLEKYQEELETIRSYHLPIFKQKFEYYSNLVKVLPSRIDSVKAQAKLDYQQMLEDEYNQWYNNLPTSTKNAYKKIAITFASLGSPNSVGGHDAHFRYVNKSNKTIKYLYWTGRFYNEVDDVVYCDIRDYSSFTGKDTGPVAPGETGGGMWDCVIYNWSAHYIKFSDISITYTDGSTFSIGAGDIARLLKSPDNGTYSHETVKNVHGSESNYVSTQVQPYTKQLNDAKKEVDNWKTRLEKIEKNDYQYTSYFEEEQYRILFAELDEIYKSYSHYKKQLDYFKTHNLIK